MAALAVACGAALGALIRWGLALAFNSTSLAVPLGTLIANLSGAYLIGLALAGFGSLPNLAPEWRLFIITGLLGGLTTFSTFSAEILSLFNNQRYLSALLGIGLHLLGSLICAALGFYTWQVLRG